MKISLNLFNNYLKKQSFQPNLLSVFLNPFFLIRHSLFNKIKSLSKNIKGDIIDYLPFKNQEQGDRFRKWINKYKPNIARLLEIKETGDYRNGFIIDAYYYHEKDYNSYLKNNQK